MSRKLILVSLLTSALCLACSEGVGPTASQSPVGRLGAPNSLKWDTSSGPVVFNATGGDLTLSPEPRLVVSSSVTDELETYSASFWSVNGADRSLRIDYQAGPDGVSAPFLVFETEELEYVPGYGDISDGDSVLITVTVDPETLGVTFSPSGLEFDDDDPAQLKIWYTGANPDFNGDGVVDEIDHEIATHFGVWMQHGDQPWQMLSGSQSTAGKWVSAAVEHFSGYAISW